MTEPRDRLVARVAVMQTAATGGFTPSMDAVNAAWELGEEWVAEREKAPDEPVKCPCCEKLVTLCLEHYQLRQPGHPCSQCREADG